MPRPPFRTLLLTSASVLGLAIASTPGCDDETETTDTGSPSGTTTAGTTTGTTTTGTTTGGGSTTGGGTNTGSGTTTGGGAPSGGSTGGAGGAMGGAGGGMTGGAGGAGGGMTGGAGGAMGGAGGAMGGAGGAGGGATGGSGGSSAACSTAGSMIFTEIMFNPNPDTGWEWVEVCNGTASAVDLTGWVFDDNNPNAVSAANIAAHTMQPGEVAVLYDGSTTSSDFTTAWPQAANLVAVSEWDDIGLNNGGDTIGLWDTFAAYSSPADHQNHSNTIITLTYDDSAPWPVDDGTSSFYLPDLSADPTQGASWSLSVDGVDGAYATSAVGGSKPAGNDIGSPGQWP